jgi:hypothetical protein
MNFLSKVISRYECRAEYPEWRGDYHGGIKIDGEQLGITYCSVDGYDKYEIFYTERPGSSYHWDWRQRKIAGWGVMKVGGKTPLKYGLRSPNEALDWLMAKYPPRKQSEAEKKAKGFKLPEAERLSVHEHEKGTWEIMFDADDRHSGPYYRARPEEEDDDHPNFIGKELVKKAADAYFGAGKIAGIQNHEKGSFSVYIKMGKK